MFWSNADVRYVAAAVVSTLATAFGAVRAALMAGVSDAVLDDRRIKLHASFAVLAVVPAADGVLFPAALRVRTLAVSSAAAG
jgi:hypothetical protein